MQQGHSWLLLALHDDDNDCTCLLLALSCLLLALEVTDGGLWEGIRIISCTSTNTRGCFSERHLNSIFCQHGAMQLDRRQVQVLGNVSVLQPRRLVDGLALQQARRWESSREVRRDIQKGRAMPTLIHSVARLLLAIAEPHLNARHLSTKSDGCNTRRCYPKVLNTALLMTPEASTSI